MRSRRPIRSDTPAGLALAALPLPGSPVVYATEDQLAKAAGVAGTSRSRSVFRDRTLQRLVDYGAIVEVDARRWSITAAGVALRTEMLGSATGQSPRAGASTRPAAEAAPAPAVMRGVATPPVREHSGTYDGSGLRDAAALRKGAFDFRACPSRMGDWLVYRDGRRVFDPIAPAAALRRGEA